MGYLPVNQKMPRKIAHYVDDVPMKSYEEYLRMVIFQLFQPNCCMTTAAYCRPVQVYDQHGEEGLKEGHQSNEQAINIRHGLGENLSPTGNDITSNGNG